MKGCFTTLLLALIAAFIAAFFGRSCHHQQLETVLNERVASSIKETYPGVDIEYDHLTAIVTGSATASEVEEIKTRVKELAYGNGRVHFDLSGTGTAVPKATPPEFRIFRDGDKITLTGVVDSEQTKAILGREAEANLGVEIDNQLEIGKNTAPFRAFGSAVAAIPALMNAAENGRIEASQKKVQISGLVESQEVKTGLLNLFASAKWNNAEIIDRLEIAPPPPPKPTIPPSFTVLRNNDLLTLTGTVDSAETRTMIGNAAKVEGVTIDNQIQISDKVMEFPGLGSVIAGIPILVNPSKNGKIEMSPEAIKLAGLVDSSATKRGILDFFSAGKWKGPGVDARIRVKPSKPSSFSILKTGKQLTLNGTVDTPRTKTMLGNAVKMEGLTVDNQIKVSEEIMPFPGFNATVANIPALVSATENGKIDFTPDKLVLSGEVADADAKDKLMALFSGDQWKGPKFEDLITIKPVPAKPPAFVIHRTDDKLTLTGTVDSPETKTRLGNAAKIDGVTIDNQIKVSNETMAFPSLDQALAGIPSLVSAAKNGKIDVTPDKVILSGLVNNQGARDRVLGHFSPDKWESFPVVDQIKIAPPMVSPTFAWRQTEPGKAVLSGRVPNARFRDSLLAAARNRLGPDAEISDKMVIDNNVKKEPWLIALPVFADQVIPKVEMPVINIDNKVSSISGKVANKTVMSDVSLAFSGINPPGQLEMNLEVKPTPTPMARTVIPGLEVTGTGRKLAVAGKVPNQKIHDSIVSTILKGKDIDKELDKKLTIGDDVKEEPYLEPLPEFISKFYNGAVRKREFWLKNNELTLRGVLESKEEKAMTLALADPLKSRGVKIIDLLTVEAPKVAVVPQNPNTNPGGKGMNNGKGNPKGTNTNPDTGIGKPPIDPTTGELHSIYYGTGESHIRKKEKSRAEKLLARARETSGKILIDGFADERGTAEFNAFLSDQRANRIKNYLIDNGIDQDRIQSVVGRGEIPNGKSYQEYRRTDVRILK